MKAALGIMMEMLTTVSGLPEVESVEVYFQNCAVVGKRWTVMQPFICCNDEGKAAVFDKDEVRGIIVKLSANAPAEWKGLDTQNLFKAMRELDLKRKRSQS